MIIEDPDAFKTWLTGVLKPICDADPEALAKYVIALVKKDKSADALHQGMVNQLQVFLQEETKPFVDQLFRTLENQAYVQAPAIPNANPPNPQLNKAEMPTKAAINKPIIPVAEIAAITETLNGKGVTTTTTSTTIVPKELKEKEDKEKDKGQSQRRRSRRRSLSRGRSRSRSWDRNRRSRSRDKKSGRSWRNKSPWRHERRRSASPSGRIRSRSRSPRHGYRGGGRYRNRSPPRSHSRSPVKDREETGNGNGNGGGSGGGGGNKSPTQQPEGNHENNTTGELKSGVLTQSSTSQESRKRRCRDYDEEGYCMRGGMCPYDHGVDAVVLEDAALSRVLYPNGTNDGLLGPPPPTVPPHMMHPRPPAMQAEYNPQAPQMWHQRGSGGFRGGHRGMNPGGPRIRMPMGPFQGGPQQIPPLPNMQRELIAVPVLGNELPPMEKYGFNPQQGPGAGYHPENMFKKKQFDFNRLGPRQKNPSNCSLELKKVPTGLNSITHLNDHFAKFGKIVNIQVCYEGDPEAAIVTFSSHAEANAAYRSTEAVLNNRFIKVFWHSGNNEKESQQIPQSVVKSVKERLGQGTIPPPSNKFLNVTKENDKEKENLANHDTPMEVSTEERNKEIENRKAQQIKKKQELIAVKEKIKKNQEEKRKEAMKLTQDLSKRKHDLLDKQIVQHKLLVDKLGKTPPGPQRDLLKQTIKKSQESIDLIRKDVEKSVLTMKTVTTPNPPKRSKEAMQKELLDAELDLISKQAEGVDTTELQKRLWELKAKASVATNSAGMGNTPTQGSSLRGRGRGTRRFNPLGRHKLVKNNLTNDGQIIANTSNPTTTTTKAHAVDHRPTRLLVSGYEADEQENVLGHFRQFGDIVDFVSDDALPSVIVNYKTRKEAEIAFNKAKHFQDRTLSVTWYTNQNQAIPQRQPSRSVLISESDEDQLMDSVALLDGDDDLGQELSEDVLLQDDEEEEEESEDRSWRR